jgi:hypothetical protein
VLAQWDWRVPLLEAALAQLRIYQNRVVAK